MWRIRRRASILPRSKCDFSNKARADQRAFSHSPDVVAIWLQHLQRKLKEEINCSEGVLWMHLRDNIKRSGGSAYDNLSIAKSGNAL